MGRDNKYKDGNIEGDELDKYRYNRKKRVDEVFDKIFDQGELFREFTTVEECVNHQRFWDREEEIKALAKHVMKSDFRDLKPHDLFNIEPDS